MSSAYAALKPFPLPPAAPLTLELGALHTEPDSPHAAYTHHLFVRPLALAFDAQRVFARARNIACRVQLRGEDAGEGEPLQVSCCTRGVRRQAALLYCCHLTDLK